MKAEAFNIQTQKITDSKVMPLHEFRAWCKWGEPVHDPTTPTETERFIVFLDRGDAERGAREQQDAPDHPVTGAALRRPMRHECFWGDLGESVIRWGPARQRGRFVSAFTCSTRTLEHPASFFCISYGVCLCMLIFYINK